MKLIPKIYPVFIILMAVTTMAKAQQLPRFSQYDANEFLVNPSVAGCDGRTSFNFAARKQWVGFTSNTPSSFLLSVQGRILKKKFSLRPGTYGNNSFRKSNKGRVGIGAIVYNDQNGAIHRTGAQVSYAYHIFIRNSQLSFGLTGNVFQYRINYDDAQLKDPEIDPLYGLIGKSTIVPDAGIGVNFMTENWHAGLAVSQVFQSGLKIGNYSDFKVSDDIKMLRQYYALADYHYILPRNTKWELVPSTLISFNELLKFESDISLKAYYKHNYWFGVSGRTTGEFVIMGGLKYRNYYFGYSFDYGFTGISRYSFGSHEISISAKFGDTARRYRWLDRY